VSSLNEKGVREQDLRKKLVNDPRDFYTRILNSEYFTKVKAKEEEHKKEEEEEKNSEEKEEEEEDEADSKEGDDPMEIVDEEENSVERERKERAAKKKAEVCAYSYWVSIYNFSRVDLGR